MVTVNESVARPANVPAERVIDFDLYNAPGVEQGFHDAWLKLHEPGIPDLVWTPHNGGHWMATRGAMIAEVFGDYARFSCRVMLVPKAVGEQHQMLPVVLTVLHGREGIPGVSHCWTSRDASARWPRSRGPELLARLLREEWVGRRVGVRNESTVDG